MILQVVWRRDGPVGSGTNNSNTLHHCAAVLFMTSSSLQGPADGQTRIFMKASRGFLGVPNDWVGTVYFFSFFLLPCSLNQWSIDHWSIHPTQTLQGSLKMLLLKKIYFQWTMQLMTETTHSERLKSPFIRTKIWKVMVMKIETVGMYLDNYMFPNMIFSNAGVHKIQKKDMITKNCCHKELYTCDKQKIPKLK